MSGSKSVASTGIAGLDDILGGGLARRRLFLVEGVPGSGKTTLALQYLRAGVEAGEAVLYVTLSETEEELHSVAESHGWQLKGIEIRELATGEGALDPDEQNTMFHPSELERVEFSKAVPAAPDSDRRRQSRRRGDARRAPESTWRDRVRRSQRQ